MVVLVVIGKSPYVPQKQAFVISASVFVQDCVDLIYRKNYFNRSHDVLKKFYALLDGNFWF